MCSSNSVVSALGMFLRKHSRLVGFPAATCCVALAALLLGVVVPSVAQPPCTVVGGPTYVKVNNFNPCMTYDTSCADSGPGYTCTIKGTSYPEYYSFTPNMTWSFCDPGGGPTDNCNFKIDMANCGSLQFFTTSLFGYCSGTCTDSTGWYFAGCEAL